MTDGRNEHWLVKVAEKIPGDIAGPVLILLALLWVSPQLLDRMQGYTQVCYLVILGVVASCSAASILLHAISNYRKNERKTWSQYVKKIDTNETQGIATETKRQVEEAVTKMEGQPNE